MQNLKKVVFLLVFLFLCLTAVTCSSNNGEEQNLPDNIVTVKLWKDERILKETQVEKGTILSENSDMFQNLFYASEKLLFWTEDKNSLQPYSFNRAVDANLNLWAITEHVQYYDLKYVEMKTNLNGFIYDLENLSVEESWVLTPYLDLFGRNLEVGEKGISFNGQSFSEVGHILYSVQDDGIRFHSDEVYRIVSYAHFDGKGICIEIEKDAVRFCLKYYPMNVEFPLYPLFDDAEVFMIRNIDYNITSYNKTVIDPDNPGENQEVVNLLMQIYGECLYVSQDYISFPAGSYKTLGLLKYFLSDLNFSFSNSNYNDLFQIKKEENGYTVSVEENGVSVNLYYEYVDTTPKKIKIQIWDTEEPNLIRIESFYITTGRKIPVLQSPEVPDWHFNGWFDQMEGGELIDFSKPVFEDTTIYVQWRKLVDGIDFELNEQGDGYIAFYAGMYGKNILEIPAEFDGKPVTEVRDFAEHSFGVVILPDSIVKIHSNTFSSVRAILLPAGLQKVERNAIDNSNNITSTIFCKGAGKGSEWEDNWFRGSQTNTVWNVRGCIVKNNQFYVILEDNTAALVYGLVFNNKLVVESRLNYQNEIIPVKKICQYACRGVGNNISIIIPEGIEIIENNAFCDVQEYNVANLTLSEGLKTIGASAFESVNICEVRIPDSVESIGSFAFYYSSSLEEVYIGTGLRSFGNHVFSNRNLKKIEIAEENPYFLSENSIIYSKDKKVVYFCAAKNGLTTFNIPDTVETIRDNAFLGHNSLEKVVFSGRVKEIQQHAFSSCEKLREVRLSRSVETIRDGAFNANPLLTEIFIPKEVKYIMGSFAPTTVIKCELSQKPDGYRWDDEVQIVEWGVVPPDDIPDALPVSL